MTTAEATGYAFKGGNIARWQRYRVNPIQRTPDGFYRKLDEEFHFTLDAAASHANAKCARYFTVEDDALGQDWGQERVWLNPPFGRGLQEWARKAWEASRAGALVVMLVPSSTDGDLPADVDGRAGQLATPFQEGEPDMTGVSRSQTLEEEVPHLKRADGWVPEDMGTHWSGTDSAAWAWPLFLAALTILLVIVVVRA